MPPRYDLSRGLRACSTGGAFSASQELFPTDFPSPAGIAVVLLCRGCIGINSCIVEGDPLEERFGNCDWLADCVLSKDTASVVAAVSPPPIEGAAVLLVLRLADESGSTAFSKAAPTCWGEKNKIPAEQTEYDESRDEALLW